MSYHVDNISEVPTKILREIAGFECENAKNFPRGSSLAYVDFLDVSVLSVACESFIVPCH